jgi:hypothetical protein
MIFANGEIQEKSVPFISYILIRALKADAYTAPGIEESSYCTGEKLLLRSFIGQAPYEHPSQTHT